MVVALVGNPNSGKTTLFNGLTGSTAHVGNWPGVTVERKEGTYKQRDKNNPKDKSLIVKHTIVDLPGVYSLTPYTPEEIVARNYILAEKPDAIINIVDATNIERNLYLTTQILEIDCPVVIALNMMDVVEKEGGKIDSDAISKKLGVPVVCISALKGKGRDELMDAVIAVGSTPRAATSVFETSEIKKEFEKVVKLYTDKNKDNAKFRAVKIIEGDSIETENNPDIAQKVTEIFSGSTAAEEFENDYEALTADYRYRFISENFDFNVRTRRPALTRSDKIDRVLTNKWAGIPIFLVIMLAVFHLVFGEDLLYMGAIFNLRGGKGIWGPGVALQELVLWGTGSAMTGLGKAMANAPAWASGLVIDGFFAGLDAVLSFLPQILLLFVFLTILEDTGYMARVAFIMDRAFRRLGLSGKAFMPLLMCFGCAVPGIMATRTLGNDKERKTAIFLSPFFSCGAKLPIWACVATIAFANYADFAVFGIYILGIAVAILGAFILSKTVLKGETPPFIMELPAYHAPHPRNVGIQLWDKFKHYLFRAATIIAGFSVIIWFLSSFGWQAGVFGMVEINNSILGYIGRGIKYIFYPMGFGQVETGWMLTVAVFTGLVAKEMVVATMGVMGGLDGDAIMENENWELMAPLFEGVAGPAAFAFMAFNLLSIPCMAAVAAARAELKDRKYTFMALAFWTITAYVVSTFIYWTGMMFTTGSTIGIVVFVLAIALVAFTIVFNILRIRKNKKLGIIGCSGNCGSCKSGCLDLAASKDDKVTKNRAENTTEEK